MNSALEYIFRESSRPGWSLSAFHSIAYKPRLAMGNRTVAKDTLIRRAADERYIERNTHCACMCIHPNANAASGIVAYGTFCLWDLPDDGLKSNTQALINSSLFAIYLCLAGSCTWARSIDFNTYLLWNGTAGNHQSVGISFSSGTHEVCKQKQY